ncbi:hypothetical protein BMETH_755_1 [methanotrophic bacterial endosymbiont of Bathymodiolus sp.]|nr:hypothetical protein BMETH_755_1 [methanotrophic bacterial endosymbiont of Bathymodiolus sp.]
MKRSYSEFRQYSFFRYVLYPSPELHLILSPDRHKLLSWKTKKCYSKV